MKAVKLVVQIPCLNEAETVGAVIQSIPRTIPGIDAVTILVIDDGSTDNTIPEALKAGADNVISCPARKGLAHAFMFGIENALELEADIIVNIDGDGQHNGTDIPALIQPILEQKADITIGDRQMRKIKHYSWLKRKLELFGSHLMSKMTGLPVKDAVCGFRAFSREAALRINLWNHFSHTLETIVFAAQAGFTIKSVPVTANPAVRSSRLARNMWSFIKQALGSTIRIYVIYQPFKFFMSLGTFFLFAGMFPVVRLIYFHFIGQTAGRFPSLVLGSICIFTALIFYTIGLLADLLSVNRVLIEKQLYESRRKNHER